jgi:hypothetical protein
VFNRDLTIDELKPLTGDFSVPGRKVRLIGGYTLLGSYLAGFALWLVFHAKTSAHALSDDWQKSQ